jgi:ankyrin repeat protein
MRKFLILLFSLIYISAFSQSKADSIKMGELLCKYSSEGKLDSVVELVKKGVNLDYKTNQGITALLYAVEAENEDITKVLVHNGANPNFLPYNKFTALMNASYLGNFEIAHYLVKNNAKINQKDNIGATALHYAVLTGRYFIADMLIFYGANPNLKSKSGNTPLMIAAFFEDTVMTNILLKSKVDLNLKNESGITALDIAAQYNNSITTKLLLDSGAVPSINPNSYSTLAYGVLSSNDSIVMMIAPKISPDSIDRKSNKNATNIAYLLGNRKMAKQLESLGFKSKRGLLNANTIFMSDFAFNGDDFFQKFRVGLDDVKYGFFGGIGTSFRYKRKNIVFEQNENEFYILKEFRLFFDAFFGNQLKVFDYKGVEFGAYTLLETQYGIGNFKGISIKPDRKLYLNPYLGFYAEYKNVFMSFSYLYTKYDYHEISNNRFSISIGVKLPNKDLPKLYEAELLEFL